MSLSDYIIIDIQKIAHIMNTNQLSYLEYIENGGQFDFHEYEIKEEIGSFANAVSLAGLKIR